MSVSEPLVGELSPALWRGLFLSAGNMLRGSLAIHFWSLSEASIGSSSIMSRRSSERLGLAGDGAMDTVTDSGASIVRPSAHRILSRLSRDPRSDCSDFMTDDGLPFMTLQR